MAVQRGFTLLIIAGFVTIFSDARSIRSRRQVTPINLPGTYKVPYGYPDAHNPLLPNYPFIHNFGTGFDFNDGGNTFVGGNLHFPVVDQDKGVYYPFDLGGDLSIGKEDVQFGFGETVGPVNPFDVPINELYPCLIGMCSPQIVTVPVGGQQLQSQNDAIALAQLRAAQQQQLDLQRAQAQNYPVNSVQQRPASSSYPTSGQLPITQANQRNGELRNTAPLSVAQNALPLPETRALPNIDNASRVAARQQPSARNNSPATSGKCSIADRACRRNLG